MAERRPIYSAQTAGRQIGYIEGDEAFDLFHRPCAIYDSNTGLLRDKSNAVVGYVSLADIFVGSSWMARDLFFKSGPIAPAKLDDVRTNTSTSGAENGNAANLDTIELIAQAHNAARANLSVTSVRAHLEKLGMEEPAPQATDFTTFESSLTADEMAGAVLSSAQFEDSSPEYYARPQDAFDLEKAGAEERALQETGLTTVESEFQLDEIVDTILPSAHSSPKHCARPQGAFDADKGLASGEPGSDYLGRTKAEASDGPPVDASLKMPEPSDESIVASAQPDDHSTRNGMPAAVEAFMQHLSGYLHSSAHETALLSSDGAAELQLSQKAESQENVDRVEFLGEHVPFEDETQRSGGPLEMLQDDHQQDKSGASEGVETHNAQRDMDRILLAVLKVVEKNSSND